MLKLKEQVHRRDLRLNGKNGEILYLMGAIRKAIAIIEKGLEVSYRVKRQEEKECEVDWENKNQDEDEVRYEDEAHSIAKQKQVIAEGVA